MYKMGICLPILGGLVFPNLIDYGSAQTERMVFAVTLFLITEEIPFRVSTNQSMIFLYYSSMGNKFLMSSKGN